MSRFPRLRDEMEYTAVVLAGPAAVAIFDRMIENGESVSMAALCATRSPPTGGVNDQIIQRNTKSVTEQFKGCEGMLNLYRKNYKRVTGENLPEDAVVHRGLAKFPGDPGCIVTHKQSLSEVKRIMKERNCQVEGDWENHPVSQAPEPQSVRINENTMSRYISEYRQEEEFAKLPEQELRELITENVAPVVTADEVMNAASSVSEVSKRVFGK